MDCGRAAVGDDEDRDRFVRRMRRIAHLQGLELHKRRGPHPQGEFYVVDPSRGMAVVEHMHINELEGWLADPEQ